MLCHNCQERLGHDIKIREFKMNGDDDTIRRLFCSDYCIGKWERSGVL